MSVAKIAITLDEALLHKVDRLVRGKIFQNRSKAIQQAVQEKMVRYDRGRLARECSKLNPDYEQSIAEEGMSLEVEQWPRY
jgi:metal-responsive CopG/Arc/MetJ family transcriptional regulator